jgi:hypothetical protein
MYILSEKINITIWVWFSNKDLNIYKIFINNNDSIPTWNKSTGMK